MPSSRSLLDPRALRRINSLELVARRIVEGTLAGLHHSPVRGFSTDFLQHRAYAAGDDLRHLDWKVFGKTDRYYVREYEDDTNLRATILLDASGSMGYGSMEVAKLDYAVCVAAALAFLLIGQHDSVGLAVFDQSLRRHRPAAAGHRQLQQLLHELSDVRPGGETSLATVLREIAPRLRRRGLVLLLTDAFDDVAALSNALARLRGQEIVLFQVLDRAEVEFQFRHWTRFDCLERESDKLLVDPAQMRQTYLERLRRFQDELRQACHDHQIDLVPLITDRPYDEALAAYLTQRGQKT